MQRGELHAAVGSQLERWRFNKAEGWGSSEANDAWSYLGRSSLEDAVDDGVGGFLDSSQLLLTQLTAGPGPAMAE